MVAKQRYILALTDSDGQVVDSTEEISIRVYNLITDKIRRLKREESEVSNSTNAVVNSLGRAASGDSTNLIESMRALGIDWRIAQAIIIKESAGRYRINGKVRIRFEPHVFYRYSAYKELGITSDSRKNRRKTEGFGQELLLPGMSSTSKHNSEWGRTQFDNALTTNGEAYGMQEKQQAYFDAMDKADEMGLLDEFYLSISSGAAQIMGFNYRRVGLSSPREVFESQQRYENNFQDTLLVRYIRNSPKLIAAMRAKNFPRIGKIYNGGNRYAAGLLRRYESLVAADNLKEAKRLRAEEGE